MMSFHTAYTGYAREPFESNVFGEAAFERNPLQWQNTPVMNQNKQMANQARSMIGYYPEIPRDDQEYNWYHTVPLTHDSYPQNINHKENIEEQFNRKGRIPNERQKRYRTSFTTFQLSRLEEEFNKDMYAVGMKRMRLAGELNLTEKQVKVWFQNRRMKYKRVCQRLHNRRMAVNKLWAQ